MSAFDSAHGIPSAYRQVATQYRIPPRIFYAVALAESGMTYKRAYRPWPWSLNIAGQSHRCLTQLECLYAIRLGLANTHSIDVGVMQINTRWHHHRVPHIRDLLHPQKNLKVAAQILTEQRRRSQSWWEAVGRYHAPANDSASVQRASRYRQRVYRIYQALDRSP